MSTPQYYNHQLETVSKSIESKEFISISVYSDNLKSIGYIARKSIYLLASSGLLNKGNKL